MYQITKNQFIDAVDQLDERQLFEDLKCETDWDITSTSKLKSPFSFKKMYKALNNDIKSNPDIENEDDYNQWLYYAGFEKFLIDQNFVSMNKKDRKHKFVIKG